MGCQEVACDELRARNRRLQRSNGLQRFVRRDELPVVVALAKLPVQVLSVLGSGPPLIRRMTLVFSMLFLMAAPAPPELVGPAVVFPSAPPSACARTSVAFPSAPCVLVVGEGLHQGRLLLVAQGLAHHLLRAGRRHR